MHHSVLDRLAVGLTALIGLTLWASFLYNYAAIIKPLLPDNPTNQTTLTVGVISVISAMTVELIHKLGPASAHTAEALFGNLKRVSRGHLLQTYLWIGAVFIFAGITLCFLPFTSRDKTIGIGILSVTLGYLPILQRLQKHGWENAKKYLAKVLYGIWLGYLLLTAALPASAKTYLWQPYLGLQLVVLTGALGISLFSQTANQFAPRWLLIKAGSYRDGIEMNAISGNKLAMQLYQEQDAPSSAKPVKNHENKTLLLVALLLRRNLNQIIIPQIVGAIFTIFISQYAHLPAVYLGTALITMWTVNKLLPVWEDWATSESTQRMVLGDAAENAATVKARNYFSYLAVLVGLSVSLPSLLALALQATPLWGLTLLVLSLLGFTAHIYEKAEDLKPKAPRPPVITPDGLVIQPQEFSNYQTWLAEALLVPLAAIWQSETLGLAVGALLLGIYVFLAKRSRKLLR